MQPRQSCRTESIHQLLLGEAAEFREKRGTRNLDRHDSPKVFRDSGLLAESVSYHATPDPIQLGEASGGIVGDRGSVLFQELLEKIAERRRIALPQISVSTHDVRAESSRTRRRAR